MNLRFTYLTALLFTFFITSSYSQVGIGTTTPDASSILDMSSTTQGVLTPRMTTAERVAIASPAKGLLVFDADLDVFYYFDGTTWQPIGGGDKRNNYKLVKSVADLSDELTAGGGSTYLLDTNTLYEINGTIVLNYSIDLNNAYLIGLDTNEDILVFPGGTLFSGNNGGSIRNLTLSAPGGTVFNIDDVSGSQNFILQSSVVANSNSVGTLKGFYLAFLNIVQYAGNTDGIAYESINDLLLNNQGWLDTNSGTYETFVGTFSLIEKVSGFSQVSAGNIGVDLSSNPTVGEGVLLSTAFSGVGNYVNGYTVGSYTNYYFTKEWFVNSPGLELETDFVASGNFYNTNSLTTGFTQTISDGTAVEIEGTGTFTTDGLFRFASSGGGNRLTYDGLATRNFKVTGSLSIRVLNAAGDFYAIMLAKNGVVITQSNAVAYIDSNTQIQNIALNCNVKLAQGDYVEVFVQRLTGSGTDTLAVFSENLSIN